MYEKGILHRDISSGNILICDDDTDDTKDAGMLIDLDHAKYSAERRAVPSGKETDADEGMEDDELMEGMEADEETEANETVLLRFFRQGQRSKLVPGSDILSKTLKTFNVITDASTYLRHVFGTLPLCLKNGNDARIWTASKLYWPNEVNVGFLSLPGVFADIAMKDQTGNPRL